MELLQIEENSNSVDWNRFSSSLIIEITRDDKTFTSTAVAISRNMLLTCAHSVDQFTKGKVCIGEVYRPKSKSIKIKKCIIHPEYNPGKSFYENDLAIIILEHNLPYFIKVEAIANSDAILPGDELDRIGFGQRGPENRRTWTNPYFIKTTFNKKNHILQDENSYIGDSGGPIFKNINGQLSLIGLHSTLEGSSKTYVVNLSEYKSWIKMNETLKPI